MKYLLTLVLILTALDAKSMDIAPFQKLKMFSDQRLELTEVYDHGSIYQIRFKSMTKQGKQSFEGFITKDKKVLIVGDSVVLKTGKALSIPKDMSAIKKRADIVYGTGKTALVVVTDPECYYCQAFQARWAELKDKYTLYVIMYPLGHHKEATKMSYYVLQQKTEALKAKALITIAEDAQADRLTAKRMQQGIPGLSLSKKAYIKARFTKKEQTKFEAKLEENQRIGETLGVRGTPAVYDDKGAFVIWSKLFSK